MSGLACVGCGASSRLGGSYSQAARRTRCRRDPKLYAFSILGPIATAVLFHEVFGSSHPSAPDIDKLAAQHAETVLHGLLIPNRNRAP